MGNPFFQLLNIAACAVLTAAAIVSCKSTSVNKDNAAAIGAVNAYIEQTMDTGQMDEFLQSPYGKLYVKLASRK